MDGGGEAIRSMPRRWKGAQDRRRVVGARVKEYAGKGPPVRACTPNAALTGNAPRLQELLN